MNTEEPKLMPYQAHPFNGDHLALVRTLDLARRYGCTTAIETGSALGGTTALLSAAFGRVWSIEIDRRHQDHASQRVIRMGRPDRTNLVLGDSSRVLSMCLGQATQGHARPFIFLDAHWNHHFPLWDELAHIASHYDGTDLPRPVLMIHDCKNDSAPQLGWDRYGEGKEITPEAIRPYLERIFGLQVKGLNDPETAPNWIEELNTPEAGGARRGILWAYPFSTR